jgi:hypothetical protein
MAHPATKCIAHIWFRTLSKQGWYTYLAEKKAQGLKSVCENRGKNRRSLHYAPPDFLLRPVALMICMRLSLRRAAHVVVASCAK